MSEENNKLENLVLKIDVDAKAFEASMDECVRIVDEKLSAIEIRLAETERRFSTFLKVKAGE